MSGENGRVEEPWDADTDLDALLASFDDLDEGDAAPEGPTALAGRPFARRAREAA